MTIRKSARFLHWISDCCIYRKDFNILLYLSYIRTKSGASISIEIGKRHPHHKLSYICTLCTTILVVGALFPSSHRACDFHRTRRSIETSNELNRTKICVSLIIFICCFSRTAFVPRSFVAVSKDVWNFIQFLLTYFDT